MVYQQNKKKIGKDKFLEALRNLGEETLGSLTHDVVGGVAETAINQLRGKQTEEVDQLAQRAPEKQDYQFSQEFLDIRRQEQLIWSQEQEKTKLQIAAVLQEIKKLIAAAKNLTQEIEVAAQQVPVEPGSYHLSFFEKLKQTLILLRKKVENAATWLAAFNQRAKKRNYYWAQVRKSGTKFMLSQERYMATQAG